MAKCKTVTLLSAIKKIADVSKFQFLPSAIWGGMWSWRLHGFPCDLLPHDVEGDFLDWGGKHAGCAAFVAVRSLSVENRRKRGVNSLRIIANTGLVNSLLLVWCKAITWTNDDLLSIGPLGTNFHEILSKSNNILLKKCHLQNSSLREICGSSAPGWQWRGWTGNMKYLQVLLDWQYFVKTS